VPDQLQRLDDVLVVQVGHACVEDRTERGDQRRVRVAVRREDVPLEGQPVR
jgi:hypothetical protein